MWCHNTLCYYCWCCQCFLFSRSCYFILFSLIYFNALLSRFDMRCAFFFIQNNSANSHTRLVFFVGFQSSFNSIWLSVVWRLCSLDGSFVSNSAHPVEMRTHNSKLIVHSIHCTIYNKQSTKAQCEIIQLKIFGILVCISIAEIGFSCVIVPIVVAWTRTICFLLLIFACFVHSFIHPY